MERILYHGFKHHFSTTLQWIDNNIGQWNDEIALKVKSLGESQLDYYIGELTEYDVKKEIAERLFLCGCYSLDKYIDWINKDGNDYRTIKLSDNSEWILRYLDKEMYVHVHPARFSPHWVRVKANILKTVVCSLLFTNELDYEKINNIRAEKLGLSPVDISKDHTELNNVFKLFNEKLLYTGRPASLYEFIELTRKRPGMYYGNLKNGSFMGLRDMITGYKTACWIHGIDEDLDPDFNDFSKFVTNYYNQKDVLSTVDCFTMIFAQCYNNELLAFQTFYKLFDKFLRSK